MPKTWWNKLFAKRSECLCEEQSKTLTQADLGQRLRIQHLSGEEKMNERLREMGFRENSIVEKMADSGSLICKVYDTKVILSKELAENIIVKGICPCGDHDMKEAKTFFLSQMAAGQRGIIKEFTFEGHERIEEMGLTPGEAIEVIRFAPLGDPIEIKVRGYSLSLRKQEADQIQVNLL